MTDLIIYYVIAGLFFNIGTMCNSELIDYWLEWGLSGFVAQLVLSTALFPLLIFVMIKDLVTNG